MRVGFVVPRYGLEVRGGAELGARMLAERLVEHGHAVDAFTTCAIEATTWADAYEPESVDIAGVAVHRFRSLRGRTPDFDHQSRPLLAHPERVTVEEAEDWILAQGPVCPDAIDAAAQSACDVLVFYPYLYHPTVAGIRDPRVAGRGVMHPAAHDEPPLRLPVFASVFAAADGFVFQTEAERSIVEGFFHTAARPQILMGLGVEPRDGDVGLARERLRAAGIAEDQPYLCCLGRVDEGKGTLVLAEFFAAFKERHPGPLALVFVGPVIHQLPSHPDIKVIGEVDESMKWALLREAQIFVNPSPYEAFSIVLIEGWSAGLPAMVNGRCRATREHCERSGGGVWFTSYATFEAALRRLLDDSSLREMLAARGARYAHEHFEWPQIIHQYTTFLAEVASRGSR